MVAHRPKVCYNLCLLYTSAIDAATQSIARSLNVQPAEIIYTSGASEANNFAIKSIARLERHHGRHILSTPLEHSSVSGSLTALQEQGYEIDLVDLSLIHILRFRPGSLI